MFLSITVDSIVKNINVYEIQTFKPIDDESGKYIYYVLRNGVTYNEYFDSDSDRQAKLDTVAAMNPVQDCVDDAISQLDITDREIVNELPTQDISTKTIYMVPQSSPGQDDFYLEYMYINNAWEIIGKTTIDLSNYLAKNNTTEFTPTGDYNPATKKYVDDHAASDCVTYLGNLSDYGSSANTLNLNGMKKGIYALNFDSSGLYLGLTGPNGQYYSNYFGFVGTDYKLSNVLFLVLRMDIPANGMSSVRVKFGDIHYERYSSVSVSGENDYGIVYQKYTLGTDTSTLYVTTTKGQRLFVSSEDNQVVAGKKTFSTLPESSVVPTTNNQLVNKKYVDDNAGTDFTAITGYDATKTQTLKNVNGTLTWVDEYVTLTAQDVENLNSIVGSDEPITSDLSEADAIERTDEIIGGNV